MAVDSDDPIALPQAPPPRPAARRAAIEAALRKFDGVEDAPPEPARKPPLWAGLAGLDRRAIGALVTAALIAVVSIPVVLTTLGFTFLGETLRDVFDPRLRREF